jgi:cellulose synthase/poly-beta-1,6-N-acetylglucosamine synthase-like glycosyltransferase
MHLSVILLHALYAVSVLGLALYGFQALWLLRHYLWPVNTSATDKALDTLAPIERWPTVSVHLPIYNERHVAERVMRASTRLKYPKGQMKVRVLDDSDDNTSSLVDRVAEELRASGHDIDVVRRDGRTGYKAGALDNAMQNETSEFIALFDADFLPQEDFLLRTIPALLSARSEDVGFVQTRWAHLNRENSVLTRSQAVALDGHFVVEQDGRQYAGFAFGFNGSGGVWRRACIDDAAVGGWQADTLCEDLDLSYRAQLAGWRGLYLGDVESPAEIPPQLLAFKRQQYRWAKGSIQTLRKLGTRVWTSEWSFAKRFAATLHLGAYLLHPMLLILLLIALPLALSGASPSGLLALLSITSVGPPLLYATSQRRLYGRDWWRNFLLLPVLMLLGTGLCLSNSIAALEALVGRKGEFLRTPKFEATEGADKWRNSSYRLRLNPVVLGEIILAAYALTTGAVSMVLGNYWTSVFMLLYAAGFGLVAAYGVWQEWTARTATRRHVASSTTVQEQRRQDLWVSGATPKS